MKVRKNDNNESRLESANDLKVEITANERLRVMGTVIVIGCILFFAIGYLVFDPLQVNEKRNDFKSIILLYSPIIIAFIYEFVAWRRYVALVKMGQTPGLFFRYINTFIEISLPTLFIWIFGELGDPVDSISLPIALMYFIFIAVSTLSLDFKISLFTGFVAAMEYFFMARLAILTIPQSTAGSIMNLMAPHFGKSLVLLFAGIVAGFVGERIKRATNRIIHSERERSRVRTLFGLHVSPAIAERLITERNSEIPSDQSESHSFPGERRRVCIIFLDIRGFTAISENIKPENVVGLLNALFKFSVEIVSKRGGILNKFLGDGFMAIFGAPETTGNDCENATLAALDILNELELRIANGSLPALKIGIGIHVGEVIAGIIGSEERVEYTVIGDAVNLASRIEQLTKHIQAPLLITDAVASALADSELHSSLVPLGEQSVRGRLEMVKVFTVHRQNEIQHNYLNQDDQYRASESDQR